MKLFVITLLGLLAFASANCPASCSGHGTCGVNDKCTCYPNWQSNDCSERKCMYGLAWADTPSAAETAHAYAECSAKGICDRKSGQCKCLTGYEGQACSRSSCPSGCSGHGTCETLEQLAKDPAVQVGGAAGRAYRTSWDAKKVQACKCDPGYSGIDCAKRLCPIGDDPLTSAVLAAQVQTITVDDRVAATPITGSFTLTFTDLYNGVWTTRPITAYDADAASNVPAQSARDLKLALESLPNKAIEGVTVTQATSGTALVYSVTFSNQHVLGAQRLMTCNIGGCTTDGCQPKWTGLAPTATSSCTVAIASNTGLQDIATCSNRGDCDHTTGECMCHSGYTDEDCSLQTVLL